MTGLPRCFATALVAVWTAAGSSAVFAAATANRPNCPQPAQSASILEQTPPAQPLRAFIDNGRYNWTSGYLMQSMETLYQVERDDRWAHRLIDGGEAMLSERDAPSPKDGQPYAWTDRGPTLSEPYVWTAFTGHVFAPLMEFARFVAEHPQVQAKTYKGKTYRDYALSFMQEFNRALAVDAAELDDSGGHATFRFVRHVPVANKRINGSPLPVNMNAGLFTAMLHLSRAEKAIGDPARAEELSRQVADFVSYLNDDVLVRTQADGRDYLSWPYASYTNRTDDVGHANLVAKFLDDAFSSGFAVRRSDLIALANSVDRLVEPDGSVPNNLLDGGNIAGSRASMYDLVLMAKYLPSLEAKLAPMVLRSKSFEYAGSWLAISRQDEDGQATDCGATDGASGCGRVGLGGTGKKSASASKARRCP